MGECILRKKKAPVFTPRYEQLVNYTMLYDSGDECTDITGGWNFERSYYNVSSASEGLKEKNSNNIRIGDNFSSYFANVLCVTANKINTTLYSKMMADLDIEYNYCNPSTDTNSLKLSLLSRYTPASSSNTHLSFREIGTNLYAGYVGYTTPNGSSIPRRIYLANISDINTSAYFALQSKSDYYGSEQIYGKIYNVAIFKPDNYQGLCEVAGVSSPNNLSSLIADTTKLTTIFNNRNAISYMINGCTGDFMASIIENTTARGLLQASPHYTLVQSNSHWAKFLAMVA